MLRSGGDAGRLQALHEGGREACDDRRVRPEGTAAEEAPGGGEGVGDRGEVDVDADPAQRGGRCRGLLLDPGRVVEPAQLGRRVERRRPRQAPHDAAFLVDADQEGLAGAAGGRLHLPA